MQKVIFFFMTSQPNKNSKRQLCPLDLGDL